MSSLSEEEDLRRKAEEEARLAEGARLKVEGHERARLKVEEVLLLSLEARRRAEEEDLGLKSKEAII